MSKRLGTFLTIALFSVLVHAQWSKQDSLNLKRILNTDGEIKLKPGVAKEIDFGSFAGKQIIADEKPALNLDVTLPKVFPDKKDIKLSLRPYTVSTRYNYDPIYQKKIDVKSDTWKYGEKFRIRMAFIYTDWAKTPIDPGMRKSVDEIEATGLRYYPLANRWGPAGSGGSPGGSVATGDFMMFFTKEFWDKKGQKRKARTREVLQNYGDSITVQIKEGIKSIYN